MKLKIRVPGGARRVHDIRDSGILVRAECEYCAFYQRFEEEEDEGVTFLSPFDGQCRKRAPYPYWPGVLETNGCGDFGLSRAVEAALLFAQGDFEWVPNED